MTSLTARPVEPGDMIPFYVGITSIGKLYSFEEQAGRPAVLLLVGHLDSPRSQQCLAAFEARKDVFDRLKTDIVALTVDDPEQALGHVLNHPCKMTIATEAAEFMQRCGLDESTPAVVVLDKNMRVLGIHAPSEASDQLVERVLTDLDALPVEMPRHVFQQAPVLLIPHVVSAAFCRQLIELFEKGGHFDSGFMTIDRAGNPLLKVDHEFKRRHDHFIQPGHPLHDNLLDVLVNRIAPEIKKAFQIDVCHCERFLIARYDQSGGYFRRHRDTTGAANAHRQFAITLNLNTEDYEGGHLAFPEYGPHLYRPATGEAILFSGALLHEALPVTKGTRYALLGFLHGAEAEQRRLDYIEAAVSKAER
jgi:predicted 2-oxoglutarate/Fe(II)-dependent dioxygenase YbiX